ncbi:hypothetical protein [Mesohalobacter halotolerans]|uniref:Lipoprotein n=1 Tax=Mesohalobacter halotolerans TaxID=1883405 RepID=A0A4U5TWL3_9FLAO|nr:hypothetical protein [Mesohalobacter halotolerans]TKS57628.1 hypothetical protein FCN74_04220 [Mesohalobacter halotolerans]
MKNIIKTITVVLGFILIGCNAVDDTRFKNDPQSGWIEFENESQQVLSDAGSVEIPIEYNVPVNRQDTSISYDVEIVEGSAPSVETGSFTTVVPADTRNASILFDIDPSISTNYTVQFTITSTSNPDVIVGLDGDNPDVFTLEVCSGVLPLEWTGSSFIDGSEINTFDMTLTPTGNEGEFNISSAWGTNFVAEATGDPSFDGQFIYDGVLTINPDNTLSIVGSDPALFPGTVLQEDALNGNLFDPCSNQLFYTLEQGLFTGDFVVDVVLTPTP